MNTDALSNCMETSMERPITNETSCPLYNNHQKTLCYCHQHDACVCVGGGRLSRFSRP